MPSKPPAKSKGGKTKPADAKRADLPRESRFASQFKKDFVRLNASGRAPMVDVKRVMSLIVDNSGPLSAQYKDHLLSGKDWMGCRECHVHGDLLPVYRLQGKADESVEFVALGTHSELFGK